VQGKAVLENPARFFEFPQRDQTPRQPDRAASIVGGLFIAADNGRCLGGSPLLQRVRHADSASGCPGASLRVPSNAVALSRILSQAGQLLGHGHVGLRRLGNRF